MSSRAILVTFKAFLLNSSMKHLYRRGLFRRIGLAALVVISPETRASFPPRISSPPALLSSPSAIFIYPRSSLLSSSRPPLGPLAYSPPPALPFSSWYTLLLPISSRASTGRQDIDLVLRFAPADPCSVGGAPAGRPHTVKGCHTTDHQCAPIQFRLARYIQVAESFPKEAVTIQSWRDGSFSPPRKCLQCSAEVITRPACN